MGGVDRGERPRDRFGRPLPRGARDELLDRREPDDVVSSVEEAMAAAVALFDTQRFFEAHEFLEWIWKNSSRPADRDFWKGVTQVAVGCVHTQRGNQTGAITLLERAVDHLVGYPSPHHGVQTAALVRAARQLVTVVRRAGASPDVAFPSLPLGNGSASADTLRVGPVPPTRRSATMDLAAGLAPGQRYRCEGCGNVTRFDVESVERVRRYWHADLSGAGVVEEEERLEVTPITVTCRWCGAADTIEIVDAPGGDTQ